MPDAAICSAWQDGARTTAEVAARTRATTGCGGCRDVVAGLVEWLAETDPIVDDPSVAELLDTLQKAKTLVQETLLTLKNWPVG